MKEEEFDFGDNRYSVSTKNTGQEEEYSDGGEDEENEEGADKEAE